MSNVFFIGDTHFHHANILKFTDKFERPLRVFSSIEEHDEYLVDTWNRVVGKRDTVFHLGDAVFGSNLSVIGRLNGTKHLILGNHDKRKPREYANYFSKLWGMKPYKYGIVMAHAPIHPSSLEYRFEWNVHGHVHMHDVDDLRYMNVSAEAIDYEPISLDELIQILDSRKARLT